MKHTRPHALISHNLLAVPELLKQTIESCERLNVLPVTAESNIARPVDRAGLYLGIFPSAETPEAVAEHQKITARKIPQLIFIAESAPQTEFLDSVRADAESFTDAADLRRKIINKLASLRTIDLESLHYVSEIPAPPADYIAHPYTLLPASQMAGRTTQLGVLSDWIKETDHKVRMMNVVAIGGMGKSAMTWQWFEKTAPTLANWAGRMWWSFYESDAFFENFVIRALAYVTNTPEDEIREITAPERERELLEILDRDPYLIVLDGIERILIAYARLDAARIDDDALDEQTANVVAGALGIPPDAQQTIFTPNRLRKTADPRAGAFLRKLASVNASRILISTRLYPADLQAHNGYPILGSFAMFLTGLEDAEALQLWRTYGCTGSDEEMLAIFRTFDNYPLIIRSLAGEVQASTKGDFDVWRRAHPDFAPLRQPKDAVKSHVMSFVLGGLDLGARRTLETIAAFRMPTFYDALSSLLVKDDTKDESPDSAEKSEKKGGLRGVMASLRGRKSRGEFPGFAADSSLDAALALLEQRGLAGWDRRANRYDLHPIVRGVVWNALDEQARKGLYSQLNAHFSAMPAVKVEDVHSLDDLAGSIELYSTLIGMKEYDEAYALYDARLNLPMLRRLSANVQRIELLEALFPDTTEKPPKLGTKSAQARAINSLALAYQMSGQPARAVPLYFKAVNMAEAEGNARNVSIGLINICEALRQTGELHFAAAVASRAVLITRAQAVPADEASALEVYGLALLAVGQVETAQRAFRRALKLMTDLGDVQAQGVAYAFLAEVALDQNDPSKAREFADKAYEYAESLKYEADYVRAIRLQGQAALMAGSEDAETLLYTALSRAREATLTEEELTALIGIAELWRREGNIPSAMRYLDDVWDQAERGPFKLLHADAVNILAQIEYDEGRHESAGRVASAAHHLAWASGEPYAYAKGLATARNLLRTLNLPNPEEEPFDESKTPAPMMPVEIEPV